MKDRSQSINRFLARRELAERIAALSGQVTGRGLAQERIRKQKARKRKRTKSKYGINPESS
jgi:hypothetical protein